MLRTTDILRNLVDTALNVRSADHTDHPKDNSRDMARGRGGAGVVWPSNWSREMRHAM